MSISRDLNAKPAASGSPIALTTVEGDNLRIYFLGNDNHVSEFAWYTNNWHFRDMTADYKAKPAASGSPIALKTVDGDNLRIYFLGNDNHVSEFAWYNNNWHFRDLTAV